MNGTNGLTASDVLALVGNKGDNWLGNGGIFALIIIFILLFGGNGLWGGNNNQLSDIQMAQYFQSQDNAIRNLANGQATITEQVMSSNYDNALLLKDLSNQMSNSVAALGNQIANQTATMTNLFNQQTIDNLRDKLATTRDELSNTRQTSMIDNAINNSTSTILNSMGRYVTNPPCYTGCNCNSLY